MNHYAQISDEGICVGMLQTSGTVDAPHMVAVAAGDYRIGQRWTGEDWEPGLEPTAQPRYLTKLGFRSRFTPAEKVAIEIACLDDPTAPMAQRQQAAMLRASQADQRDATYINPKLPATRDGVLMLEAAGILAAGRALQILDAYVEDHEHFKG